MTAEQLIQQYLMLPHPEGGWYKETYRSNEIFPGDALPERFDGNRVFATAIYFLLEKGQFSAFHRIKSDECWHFYAGGPMEIYMIREDGTLDCLELGNDISRGQSFQQVVPANSWLASRPATGSIFSFAGCTVAPGFEFADFELAEATHLIGVYPQHAALIRQLCK